MKLELKHLVPYLPYGLKWVFDGDDTVHEVSGLDINTFGVQLISDDDFGRCTLENGKPILRPLSDVTEAEARSFLKLAHGGLINSTEVNIDTIDKDDLYLSSKLSDGTIVCLRANHTLDGLCISIYSIPTNDNTTTYPTPLFIYNLFFKHHFDVFGLINNNLAIAK